MWNFLVILSFSEQIELRQDVVCRLESRCLTRRVQRSSGKWWRRQRRRTFRFICRWTWWRAASSPKTRPSAQQPWRAELQAMLWLVRLVDDSGAQCGCHASAGYVTIGPGNLHFIATCFNNAKAYKIQITVFFCLCSCVTYSRRWLQWFWLTVVAFVQTLKSIWNNRNGSSSGPFAKSPLCMDTVVLKFS